ncbi:MAG: hypothetical protein U1D06_01070, partial [Paracoccaceae bacterium]|nr:hypothetical protein [Paracoccaceae bacterium]
MRATSAVRDVLWPLVFTLAMAYIAWYLPKFIITFGGATDALKLRFAPAGMMDFAIAAVAIAAFLLGVAFIRPAPQEGTSTGIFDRMSLFLGRVTM